MASVVFTENPTKSINPLILTDFSSFCPHSQFFVVSLQKEQLKPFGKMKTILYLIITIFSFAISIPLGLTLSFLFIMYQILKRGSGTGGANRNPPTYLD